MMFRYSFEFPFGHFSFDDARARAVSAWWQELVEDFLAEDVEGFN